MDPPGAHVPPPSWWPPHPDPFGMLLADMTEMKRTLARIERREQKIMALTVAEQTAVAGLAADIETLGTAMTTTNDGLRAQIATLTTLADELRADDDADAAHIATLDAAVAALQATLDAQEADVVGALGGLDSRVKALTPSTP